VFQVFGATIDVDMFLLKGEETLEENLVFGRKSKGKDWNSPAQVYN